MLLRLNPNGESTMPRFPKSRNSGSPGAKTAHTVGDFSNSLLSQTIEIREINHRQLLHDNHIPFAAQQSRYEGLYVFFVLSKRCANSNSQMGALKYVEELQKKKQSDVLRFLLRVRCWEVSFPES